ncbi:MAG: hypothetical protein U0640_08130 [Phycisphaerales bacterium]
MLWIILGASFMCWPIFIDCEVSNLIDGSARTIWRTGKSIGRMCHVAPFVRLVFAASRVPNVVHHTGD